MKSTRAMVMIAISFLVAIGAVLIASQWIKQQPSLTTRQVAVAASDIEIGSRLTKEMVRIAEWPAGSIPQGAYNSDDKLLDRVARTSIQRGEPVLESKLAPLGTKGGLSAIVAEGKRAMSVRVNDVVGVAGFPRPGDYVDILVNTQEEGASNTANKDASVSKIVLEHILLLAIAQESSRDETKPKVVSAVTLEVTPEEAEKLDLARSVGTLSLVLRNQVDPKEAATKGATKATLLGKVTPPAPPAPAVKPAVTVKAPAPRPRQVAAAEPPKTCVSVVTGTEVSRECF